MKTDPRDYHRRGRLSAMLADGPLYWILLFGGALAALAALLVLLKA